MNTQNDDNIEKPRSSFLTTNEAAAFLRLSPRTLERHRLIGSGTKFCRLGRKVVYRLSDLEAWASERTFSSTSEITAVDKTEG